MNLQKHDDLELMSQRRLSDSLDATRLMLRQAQQIAGAAQAALLGLAGEFCPNEIQAYQERGLELSRLPANELAELLRGRYKAFKTSGAGQSRENLALANQALEMLRADLKEQRQRAERAEEQARRLQGQVSALERALELERKAKPAQPAPLPQAEPPEDAPEPDHAAWMEHWRQANRSYERDSALILMAGQSGAYQARELESLLVENSAISRSTARRAILESIQAGLLESKETAFTGGRPARVLALTERGRWLYKQLSGQPASPPQLDALLDAHKSERHLAQILRIADQFYRLGCQVERQPLRLPLGEGSFFQPDLVVRMGEETFYLEVELGGGEKTSLPDKWQNALTAGGRICVATDNLTTLRGVQGSIAQWAAYEGKQVSLYVTYEAHLKAAQPGDSPWFAVKEYNR
jgi:hypothetical protein